MRSKRLMPLAWRVALLRAWHYHPLGSPFALYDPARPRALRVILAATLLLLPLFLTGYMYTNLWWTGTSPLLPPITSAAQFLALATTACLFSMLYATILYTGLLPATAKLVMEGNFPLLAVANTIA